MNSSASTSTRPEPASCGARRLSYLDEFVFRFNRRKTRHAAFRSLLAIGLAAKPIIYKMLIMPGGKG